MSPGDPWTLPAARLFLREVVELAADGGGLLISAPSMPGSALGAVERALRTPPPERVVRTVGARVGASFAEAVAVALAAVGGSAETLARESSLMDHVALVDLTSPSCDIGGWISFIGRFLSARPAASSNAAIVGLCGPQTEPKGLPHLRWSGRLRRMDASIWADLHAPREREEPIATLAHALAVELGAWRLDLVAHIAAAPYDNLLDPLGLFTSSTIPAELASECFDGEEWVSAKRLLEDARWEELNRRIWRAQLRALFPWLEELRQELVRRYRSRLQLDDQQRLLGINVIDDIALGGIAYQLNGCLVKEDCEAIFALARMRNALAHGNPVLPMHLRLALRRLTRIIRPT